MQIQQVGNKYLFEQQKGQQIYLNQMSQPSSSIVSADTSELKYKKALKEISKLIAANRILNENSNKSNKELQGKIEELSIRYEDLEKQYEIVRKEKDNLALYLDQVQKQRNNLERQNTYLTDWQSQKIEELNKLQLHKDQKAIANLIRTYEDNQAVLKKNRTQNQEMINKLKEAISRLQNEIEEERASKEESENRFYSLTLELSKYKEMNASLMTQNQRILMQNTKKDSFSIQKEKELQLLIGQLKTQVSLFKQKTDEPAYSDNTRFIENYEFVLSEKNKLEGDIARLQDAFEEAINRQKEYYEIEEREKSAQMRCERAIEEVNMLKNKIVVMEAREFLDEAGDDEYHQKEFEEKLSLILAQNDPLTSLKNGDDSSHFRILKSFIVDLQDKVYKYGSEKKQISKKYKSLKNRFVKNAEQLKFYEGQNKLMKGKLQGYERLSEKLQFQLEKTLASNEEQITKMTITSNNMLNLKTEEYKSTIAVLTSQLEMAQEKGQITQKNLKQQIDTLKLELDAMKIKYRDEADNFTKQSELMELYKKKNNEMNVRIGELEDELLEANQTTNHLQEVFKEEKGKNQGLVSQKQQLIAQNKHLTQELDKKMYQFNENTRTKQETYEYESKRSKIDNAKLKEEMEYMSKEMKSMRRELEQKRHSEQMQVEEIKRLNSLNNESDSKLVQLKKIIRDLHNDNDTLKIKAKKFQDNYEKYNKLEEELISKTDIINDLMRDKLMFENDLKNIEAHLNEEKKINGELQKEISANKLKTLQSNHDIKKQYENKALESKKSIQSLNQDISDLTSELREEKSKNLRLNNEVNNVKAEKTRLQELMEQNRKKDFQAENQLGNLKLDISSATMDIERLKNDLKSEQANSNILNQEIEGMQQKIYSLNQEISGFKMKVETVEDQKRDLVRDLNSIKYNFSTVENHSIKLKSKLNQSWDEQNFANSLLDMITKLRKIGRSFGVTFEVQANITDSQGSAGKSSYYSHFKTYAQENESSGVHVGQNRLINSGVDNLSIGESRGFAKNPISSYEDVSYNIDRKITTVESIKNSGYAGDLVGGMRSNDLSPELSFTYNRYGNQANNSISSSQNMASGDVTSA